MGGVGGMGVIRNPSDHQKAEKAEKTIVYVYSLNHKAEKTGKAFVYVYSCFCDPRNTHKQMLLLTLIISGAPSSSSTHSLFNSYSKLMKILSGAPLLILTWIVTVTGVTDLARA